MLNGVGAVTGDLENQASIANAMEGVDAAVFSISLVFDLEKVKLFTANFIAAAKEKM